MTIVNVVTLLEKYAIIAAGTQIACTHRIFTVSNYPYMFKNYCRLSLTSLAVFPEKFGLKS